MCFGQNRGVFKVATMKGVAAKEISTIKKEPSSLYWNNRKESSTASQKCANLARYRLKGVKV